MSKGLKALQDIRLRIFIESEVQSKKVVKDLKTIEKELKEYEELKKPKRIVGTTTMDKALKKFLIDNNPSVAKELKALEIIKEKEINIHALLLHLKRFDSPIGYNALVGEKYQLAQEEYDLLKEVLL